MLTCTVTTRFSTVTTVDSYRYCNFARPLKKFSRNERPSARTLRRRRSKAKARRRRQILLPNVHGLPIAHSAMAGLAHTKSAYHPFRLPQRTLTPSADKE